MLFKITELSSTESTINADIQNNFYFFYRKRCGPIKWFSLKQRPNNHNHSLGAIIRFLIYNYIFHIYEIYTYSYIYVCVYISRNLTITGNDALLKKFIEKSTWQSRKRYYLRRRWPLFSSVTSWVTRQFSGPVLPPKNFFHSFLFSPPPSFLLSSLPPSSSLSSFFSFSLLLLLPCSSLLFFFPPLYLWSFKYHLEIQRQKHQSWP